MSTSQPTKASAASAISARDRKAHVTTRTEKATRRSDPALRSRIIKVLIFVALAFAMLYRPTRDFYIAWRTGYLLESRREALAEENEELSGELERLMTREGIEDEARRHGYVMPGETSVRVEGLEEEPGQESADKGEQELPWYIRLGDVLFFYGEDA